MWQLIKQEKRDFSRWFTWAFSIIFCVYIIFWVFTIHLSKVQLSNGFEPVLPVATMDSTEYRNLAESMLSGNGFAQNGVTDTLIAPGYPSFVLFIKYLSGTYFTVTLIQILLVFISALVIRRLGILFYSSWAGEIAAIFFVVNPVVLVLSLSIMTDILFLFLFITSFYLASSRSYKILGLVFLSLMFASAIYVRPMGVFALPIFAAPFLVRNENWREKTKSILIMIVVISVAVSPWVFRNYKISGVADFSSFRSANLGLYAAPMFLSTKNHTDLEVEKSKISEAAGVPVSNFRDLRYSKEVSAVAMKIILSQPFTYIKYHLTTSLSFLFSSSIQYGLETYRQAMHLPNDLQPGAIGYLVSYDFKMFLVSISKVWWKVGERILWLSVYIVTILGVWGKRKNKATWAFIFVWFYLMLLAGPMGNARYSVQSLPFKSILFAVGVVWLINRVRNK